MLLSQVKSVEHHRRGCKKRREKEERV